MLASASGPRNRHVRPRYSSRVARDLLNTFTWSTSRDRLFRDCLRAYWYRYYAHWGGWSAGAAPLARIAYRLGKMDSLDTWAGSIVHDTLEEAIHALRDHGRPIEPGELARRAREKLRRGWVESRDGAWRARPKLATNLFEHYYGREADLARDRTDAVAARVYESLDGFARSDWPRLLASLRAADWRNVEGLDSVEVAGHTAWVKPDLAFRHPDEDRFWLVDWKTGRPRDEDSFQLACYALYALRKWGVEPERVTAILAYLAAGERKSVPLDAAAVAAAEERIATSMAEMRALLRDADADANVADLPQFPMTERRSRCERCNFRQLCYGGDGVPGARLADDPPLPLQP
jgi:CRISPR/Cas system-associated exonuclease Cas4 (RecB family)